MGPADVVTVFGQEAYIPVQETGSDWGLAQCRVSTRREHGAGESGEEEEDARRLYVPSKGLCLCCSLRLKHPPRVFPWFYFPAAQSPFVTSPVRQ